jgi:hypothetical protein
MGLFLVVAALLAGCGDDDSGGTSGAAVASNASSPRQGTISRTPNPVSSHSVIGVAVSTPTPATSHSATLSWEAPTSNTNGSALTDLAGYRIYYGPSESDLSESVQVTSVGIQTYVIENLRPGTWYFAIQTLTSEGTESALSGIVEKTIG